MSFRYEPASEPLHIIVKLLFSDGELCRVYGLAFEVERLRCRIVFMVYGSGSRMSSARFKA